MKKLLLVCLLAVIGTGAFGTVFPRGNGLDIANPATWGLVDTIPTDLLVYQNANASSTVTKKWYTASKDIAVGGIYCDYGTLELNLPADRTITMNGDLFCYNGPFVLTGGIYDFKNTSAFRTGTWSQYVYPGRHLNFDGCVLTNLPSVYLQNNAAAGGKWMLKNGAGFHVNGMLCLAAYDTLGGGLTLSLASGSKVVCRYFRMDDGQKDTFSHFTGATLSLTGAGTSFVGDMTGVSGEYHKLGQKHAGVRVIVDDRNEKLGRKIRDNELKRIPYMLIVGEKEAEDGKVSVRQQGAEEKGQMTVQEFADLVNTTVKQQMESY